MPITDANFSKGNGDPYQKLQKILDALGKPNVDVDVQFIDKDTERPLVTRTLLELTIQEYSLSSQNPQMFNKWLAVDEKVNKAIRQFKSDVLMLITGQAQLGQAQASLQAEAPPAAPTPTPAPQQAVAAPKMDKNLPTEQK